MVACLVKFCRDFQDGERTASVRYSGASPSARGLLARKRSANKPEKIEADLLFPGTKSLKSILKYCNTRFLRIAEIPHKGYRFTVPRTFLHFPDKIAAPDEPKLYLLRFIKNTEINNTYFILLRKQQTFLDA